VAIAFFDLDKTILSVNSGTLWVRREFELGFLKKRHAARAVFWLAKYKLGFAGSEDMIHEAVAHLKGTSSAMLQARTEEFYERLVKHTVRPGALRALADHRARGDQIVLLTSSSNYLSKLVAADLHIEHILCNTLGVDASGLHTGQVVGRACFGEGKLVYAQSSARALNSPLSEAWFYTDSYADVSVMKVVGHPVAIHPDPRLRRWSEKLGHQVLDWGE
jgi:HAD superfamily hydrolase (TIGR01490 family)